MYEPYKSDDISCKNTFGVKKVWPSKVESYLVVNVYMNRLATIRSDTKLRPRLRIYIEHINTTLDTL